MNKETEALIELAAERGARKALESIGLHDEEASKDLMELRGILASWREARKAAVQTVARIITTGLMAILAIGFWVYFQDKK